MDITNVVIVVASNAIVVLGAVWRMMTVLSDIRLKVDLLWRDYERRIAHATEGVSS